MGSTPSTSADILMEVMTQAEYAAARGWSKAYVTKLKQQGRLVMTDDGRVRTAESDKLIAETANGDGRGGPNQPAAENIGGSMQASRAVREKYLALTAKRDYEQSCGKLVEIDKVRAYVADAATTLRTRIESLPVMAGPLVAAESDEARCVALLREIVEQCLNELASKFSALSQGGAQR